MRQRHRRRRRPEHGGGAGRPVPAGHDDGVDEGAGRRLHGGVGALTHIADKLVRRHPHVFAGAARRTARSRSWSQWDAIKAQEKAEHGSVRRLRGSPAALVTGWRAGLLPAAGKGGQAPEARRRRSGSTGPVPEPVWDKIDEELRELRARGAGRSTVHEIEGGAGRPPLLRGQPCAPPARRSRPGPAPHEREVRTPLPRGRAEAGRGGHGSRPRRACSGWTSCGIRSSRRNRRSERIGRR